ncbi:hypothetical protein EZJ49_16130 [Bdellovibrio bacteriovorus]|uniref:hypothetical protein n=1 Tax=Bdellovibrio bacteriovorus TaxID=959 RepID=UPI0021CF5C67|nr:hypothetical protein [Bdellovibrio bacteriovorus]UXR64592.1 hypothetical protein EZJ49_16130 [Bdellovibrio bacteriovorus]
MFRALFALSLLSLSACSHSISLRASHFNMPVVVNEQWQGHAAIVMASETRVTLVNDINANPPLRDKVLINNDVDASDFVAGANNVGFDASLSVFKGLELYVENFLWGARFQFLNHGTQNRVWVGSIMGAYGTKSETTTDEFSVGSNTTDAKAKSDITTSQAGISLGYKYEYVVPYFSYIYEAHNVKTNITSTNGTFGPYKDDGIHGYYSLGLSTHQKGFRAAIEYSHIDIKWDRSDRETQEAFGLKLGYAW